MDNWPQVPARKGFLYDPTHCPPQVRCGLPTSGHAGLPNCALKYKTNLLPDALRTILCIVVSLRAKLRERVLTVFFKV